MFIGLPILQSQLNQMRYQDVPCIPFDVCQIWRQSDYMFAFYVKCEKEEKPKKK